MNRPALGILPSADYPELVESTLMKIIPEGMDQVQTMVFADQVDKYADLFDRCVDPVVMRMPLKLRPFSISIDVDTAPQCQTPSSLPP